VEIIDITIVRLGIGLLLLILANIALGSVNAFIEGTWDSTKFRNGCIKGGAIAAALVAVYLAGWLNPDLFVVEAEGQQVNLMTAVHIALLASFTVYAIDVIKKLKDMLTTETPGGLVELSEAPEPEPEHEIELEPPEPANPDAIEEE